LLINNKKNDTQLKNEPIGPVKQPLSMLSSYNQIMEKDGTIVRRKCDIGKIYRSVNQTNSLFIEPNDILKQIEDGDYTEYCLFPHGETLDDIASSIFSASAATYQNMIKEHFYSI
jgi:hypothetical protein